MRAQIISLIIAVSLLGLWFVGTRPLPESALRGINISRNNYEAALSKWQAQAISDYTITVEHKIDRPCGRSFVPCGIHTSQVTGDEVRLISPITERIPSWQADFEGWTVEDLFQLVETKLDTGRTRSDAYPGPTYFKYNIEFDEQLGYPRRVRVIASGATAHSSYIQVTEVKSLQILERR